jgi:hypothetical protein
MTEAICRRDQNFTTRAQEGPDRKDESARSCAKPPEDAPYPADESNASARSVGRENELVSVAKVPALASADCEQYLAFEVEHHVE